MIELINFPMFHGCLDPWGGDIRALSAELKRSGLQGIEAIDGADRFPAADLEPLVLGYHMTFFPDWADFWNGDLTAVKRKFGSLETAFRFYRAEDRESFVNVFKQDLRKAISLRPHYVVFHASDVSIEEGYTYRWEHSDREVIDASCELINRVLDGEDIPFLVLVENQWWPGLTLLDKKMTQRVMDAVAAEQKGILLDTGHLMNTDPALRSQTEGARYILDVLDGCGVSMDTIRAIHLHQSLSGGYVRENTGNLPEDLAKDYLQRFSVNYAHITRIDRHEAWSDPAVRSVIEKVRPDSITHELKGNWKEKEEALSVQRAALKG